MIEPYVAVTKDRESAVDAIRHFTDCKVVRVPGYYRDGDATFWIYSENWLAESCWIDFRRADTLGLFCHHVHFYAVFDFQKDSPSVIQNIMENCIPKWIAVLAASLTCHALAAEVTPQYFQTVDGLIANVKQAEPTDILYDTNGVIVGVYLPLDCSTDRNLHLLSKIKSVRYLHICGNFISANGILALAEYPKLTGLGIVCGGGGSKDLLSALPCLTNLQSLGLAQNIYKPHDAIYLAKMTNLVALQLGGSIPQMQAELLLLTNLVHLQKLLIWSSDDAIKKVDASIFSRFDKLTTFLITSDLDLFDAEDVWKMPP